MGLMFAGLVYLMRHSIGQVEQLIGEDLEGS
jgi:hypothetical protein